jgi:hypothetical protein
MEDKRLLRSLKGPSNLAWKGKSNEFEYKTGKW